MATIFFSNFRRYNAKGQRLAIFCRKVEAQKDMEIFILRCSRKDIFSKKVAKDVYERYVNTGVTADYHPQVFNLLIDNNKPKYTFLRWCNNNTYKPIEMILDIPVTVLSRGETILI